MSTIGIVADLVYGPMTVPGGYVEVSHIKGGPNYQPEGYAHVEGGQWMASISWYASLESRQTDPESNIQLPKIPGYSPRDYMQLVFAYTAGADPYETAMAILQTWFPSGLPTDPTPVIVPEEEVPSGE